MCNNLILLKSKKGDSEMMSLRPDLI